MSIKRVLLTIGLLCSAATAQTTTTITGTLKDLTNAVVTSGKVTFTLRPSADTTISGVARFSPQTINCLINGSGLIKAQDGVSTCTLTMNTALQPTGTYYQVGIWPYNVKTSTFTFYAVLSTYDWSTVVPTPTTSPAQNFVDIFSNQAIAGNKTFTAITNSGISSPTTTGTDSGAETIQNKTIQSPVITTGINNNGSGFKHQRFGAGCTTGAGIGSVCDQSYTWTTAFADANYTVNCTITGFVANQPLLLRIYSKTGAGFIATTSAQTAAAAQYSSLDCIGVHD